MIVNRRALIVLAIALAIGAAAMASRNQSEPSDCAQTIMRCQR